MVVAYPKPFDENLKTMVLRVRGLIRGGSGDTDRILWAIHDAITHIQNTEHLWWMDSRGRLLLEDGVDLYSLEEMGVADAGLRYVEGDLWLDIDADPNNRHRVVRRTPDFLEDKREFQRYSNWPEYWAIEGDRLMLWPTPDGPHAINFRGVAKWPPPVLGFNNDGTETIKDWDGDFTNPWFHHGKGFELVMNYSRYLLAEGSLADDPEAMRAQKLFLEIVAGQRASTDELHLPHRSDPWPHIMD